MRNDDIFEIFKVIKIFKISKTIKQPLGVTIKYCRCHAYFAVAY